MSQFRIKHIDTGLIDEWTFRIDDQGLVVGDDVIAQDPNELAQAVSDTQDLLLKASVYAPSLLIDPASGALERIKIIEDTFGTTTLQNAYDNGRFISVTPGRPLSLGATGEIELDSSGNLRIDANTFKITNGVADMFISSSGISSSSSDLTFGTISVTNNTLMSSNNELLFKDKYLVSNISLSEPSNLTLLTASQSLVGAINEVSSGFTGTDLQQIYDQSAPPTINTSFGGGPITIINGSGNPNTPALIIDGGISTVDFIDADKITVGPGAAINITIDSDGSITTIGDIETSGKVTSPRLENLLGEITFLDSRGTATLTELGEASLSTVKQSLFGAINEIDNLANQNANTLLILNGEHDLLTGLHKIINTQSAIGSESTSRLNIKDGGAVTRISMNALGEIVAIEATIAGYVATTEFSANETHRNDDGTSHSAVASHLIATNPHNVVKTVKILGDAAIAGAVVFEEGTGITLTRVGQNIIIAAPEEGTLQSVYDNQLSGNLDIDTLSGKNLFFRNSTASLVMAIQDSGVSFDKAVSMTNAAATIDAVENMAITVDQEFELISTIANVSISSSAPTKTVNIQGIPFTDTGSGSIDNSLKPSLIGSMNDLASNHYISSINGTGVDQLKGTAVAIRKNGTFWTLYPDIKESNALLRPSTNLSGILITADTYWRGSGVLDENILAGATGRVRTSGLISASVGKMDASTDWYVNDTLYISRSGYSEVDIATIGSLADGDTITLDTATAAKVFTAKTSGANPLVGQFDISATVDLNIKGDETRDNLLSVLNDEAYMAVINELYLQAFIGGETAKGRARATAVGAVGNTYTLTPSSGAPGGTIVLTSVANGTTPSWLQYELGSTAAETSIYLAEAINRTSLFDGLNPQTAGLGHGCFARSYGDSIEIEWTGPGMTGNNIGLSSTGGAVTTDATLSGGTAKIHIYKSDRTATGLLCSASNAAALSCLNFTDDEGDSQYLNTSAWFSSSRIRKNDDRRIKIGKVISFSDPILTFMVDVEEPRKNKTLIKGEVYDTEY